MSPLHFVSSETEEPQINNTLFHGILKVSCLDTETYKNHIYIHTDLFICIYYCCPQYVSKFYINQKGLGNLDCFNYEPNLLT